MLNKILRIICNVKYDDNIPLVPTNTMYKNLGLLQFPDIHKYFLLKFIHFIMYEHYDIFIDVFSQYLPNNSHDTRNSRINLPYARADIEKRFTVYQFCNLFREVPEEFLVPQSSYSIKKNFKEFLMRQY